MEFLLFTTIIIPIVMVLSGCGKIEVEVTHKLDPVSVELAAQDVCTELYPNDPAAAEQCLSDVQAALARALAEAQAAAANQQVKPGNGNNCGRGTVVSDEYLETECGL